MKRNLYLLVVGACIVAASRGYLVGAGCFQCPGLNESWRPSPTCAQGTSTPDDPRTGWQCNTYVLDQDGFGFGPCVPCYEPSYKKCAETNPGNLTETEYIGRCLDVGWCDAIPGLGPLYRGLPLSVAVPVSQDVGYCDAG